MSIFKEILCSGINEVIFPSLYECTKFLLLYVEITNQTRQAPFSDASSCSVNYRHTYAVCLFVCFPGVTTHCVCIFHSPVAGFSLLVFEVS
jgi:hypothetical protein